MVLTPAEQLELQQLQSFGLSRAEQEELAMLEAAETAQQRALTAGAVPGVAVTPAQRDAIAQGGNITPTQPTLTSDLAQAPPAEGQPFARSVEQGLMNIGGGILRGVGELADQIGVDGAQQFLDELAASTKIEQAKTDVITKDAGVQRFAGEVTGEVLGFPVGGGGSTLLKRIMASVAAGGTGGGLSAAGRGEEGVDIAIETGLGATLAPAVEGLAAFRNARKLSKQADQVGGVQSDAETISDAAGQVEEAVLAESATGIRTLPAQKTLDPFTLETQSFLGQNPEVSRKAFNVLRTQNQEAAQAVDNLLTLIAHPLSPSTAPAQARRASENIISSAELIRAENASPIYKQAFRRQRQFKTPPIDTGGIELKASKIIEQFDDKGQVAKNLKNALSKIERANGDLSKLHNAKLEIDQIIEARGENAIGRTTKRFVTDLQKDLLTQMDAQSPSYRAARETFRELSPPIDELRDGVSGRLAGLDDLQLKQASGIIFDADTPQIAANAIKTLKGVEGGADIAQGLLRSEIEKRLGRMRIDLTEAAETGGRKLENLPQNLLNNFFGNAKQKRVLFEALEELNPSALTNAKWLEKSLIRSSSGRPGGSQTGIRNVITEQLRGPTLAIRNFFRKPLESLAGIGEQEVFSQKTRALGDALYDVDWKPDMARIRKMKPDRAQSEFEKLLTNIAELNQVRTSTQAIATAGRQEILGEE